MTQRERDIAHARIAARIAGAAGSISGLNATTVDVAEIARGTVSVVVKTVGWSPTLHRINLGTRVQTRTADVRDSVVAASLLDALEPFLARQRDRLDAALDLGLHVPLVPGDAGSRNLLPDVAHLHVDRSLAALWSIIEGCPAHHAATVLRSVHASHNGDFGGRDAGEPVTRSSDKWCGDIAGVRAVGWELSPIDPDDLPAGTTWLVFNGRRIAIVGHHQPESLVAAMAGRRVGEIIRIHPLLDDRIVEGARNDHDETDREFVLDLVPDLVRIPDVAHHEKPSRQPS